MNLVNMIFGKKHALLEKKIEYEKARADGNKQAIQSGTVMLTMMSNALSLIAEDANATNYRK